MTHTLNDWCRIADENARAKGFTHDTVKAIALMHQELSELLEAHRTDPEAYCGKEMPNGDRLPLTMEAEECADIFLRLANYCGARGIDLDRAVDLKHLYNTTRPHRHGKRF